MAAGQIAQRPEIADGGGPVSLGELAAVGSQDQGMMPVAWRRLAQGREKHQLAGGVGDVVLAPDDVGDLHAGVVDHHGEVVGEAAVGALDDEVADDVGREGDGPVDEVVEGHVAVGHPEADGRLLARGEPAVHLGRRTGRQQQRSYLGISPRASCCSLRSSSSSCGQKQG